MTFFNIVEIYTVFKRSSFFLLLFCFYACTPENEIIEYSLSGKTMGTVYNIKLINKPLDNIELTKIKSAIDSSLIQVNQQMSTYISDSEISRFNNHKDTSGFKISSEFSKVIKEALRINEISTGAFDITVNPLVNLWGFGSKSKDAVIPAEDNINNALKLVGSQHINFINNNTIKKDVFELEVDLSAIAKGYGVDVVSRVLELHKSKNFMVEIGGEIFTKGKNIYNEKWKIGIDKPKYLAYPGNELQDTLNISDVALATSGDYRNYFEHEGKIYSHTINPKTGKPVTHNLASVTIIAPRCMQADALATAVLVMGVESGMKLLESIENVEGYFIKRIKKDEFEVISTTGFENYQ
jgi:FAD:protein FMN transferase